MGKKFGKLTVLIECEELKKNSQKVYKCICDCGNICYVRSGNLISGNTKSCGCLVGKFHGKRDTKLYSVWSHFKGRCYNLNDHKYSNYGGRGIEVCDEWRNNFQAFYDWSINNGYKEGLTIDRIDVDGDYEPNNCRWVDQKTQQNNRRNNTRLTYNGKTQTISQWASELSVNKKYYKH